MTEQIYQNEMNFVNRKIPTIKVAWQAREITEQLISSLLLDDEANKIYNKLHEVFHARAGLRIQNLLQKVIVDKKKMLGRVIVSVKWLREIFPNELAEGDGGGGGLGMDRGKAEMISRMRR